MPRREGLPLYNFGVGCNVASCGYQQRRKTKVDRHRIAYLLSAYQRGLRMQFFAMTIYIYAVGTTLLRQNYVMPRLCYGSAYQVNLLCSRLNRKVQFSVFTFQFECVLLSFPAEE